MGNDAQVRLDRAERREADAWLHQRLTDGPGSRDSRDAVMIEALADSEAALLDELVKTRAARDTYRLIAVQAIHALCDRTQELDRLRAQHHRLRDEYRAYRAATLTAEAA